jgi:predicted HicB family RNase H-like nuclease
MNSGERPHPKQFPLRLPRSLKAAAQVIANRDGISLNQFINLAVAEKVERIGMETSSPPNTNSKQA